MKKNILILSLVLSLGLVFGCGRENPPASSTQPVVNNTTDPQATNPETFKSVCTQIGGSWIQAEDSPVCRTAKSIMTPGYYELSGSYFPLLTPSSSYYAYPRTPEYTFGSYNYAYNSAINAEAGDRLVVKADGRYGNCGYDVNTNEFLGGLITFSTWKYDCDAVSISGGGQSNEGLTAGLVVSIGADVIFVGKNSNLALETSGTVKFGIMSISTLEIQILRRKSLNTI